MGYVKNVKDLFQNVADNIKEFLKKAWDYIRDRSRDWRNDMKKCARPWAHFRFLEHWRLYIENPGGEWYVMKLEPSSVVDSGDIEEIAYEDLHGYYVAVYDIGKDDFELLMSSVTNTEEEMKNLLRSYNLHSHLLNV